MQLPLETYQLDAVATSWPSGFAARRFQDTAYLPYVEEALQLRGFDAAPVVTTTGVTFARVDGRWRIVSDDDVADREPDGSRNKPWDLTRIVVRRTPHALGIFDAASAPSADRLMAWTEQSVGTVRRAVPLAWPGRVVFYALSSPRLLRGMGTRFLDRAAIAFPVYDDREPADPAGGDAGGDQPALPAAHRAPGHLPAQPRDHPRGPGPHQRRDARRGCRRGSPTSSRPAGPRRSGGCPRRPRWPGPARAPTRCPAARSSATPTRPSSTTSRWPPARCSPTGSAPTGCGGSCERLSAAGFADGDAEAHTDEVLGTMFGLDSRRLARARPGWSSPAVPDGRPA